MSAIRGKSRDAGHRHQETLKSYQAGDRMLGRMIMLVVFAAAIGAVLLGLRQQRLQLMHEMTRMHSQMNRSRQDTWDLQVKIAERTQPDQLRQAVTRLNLELEPITPADPQGWSTPVAEAHRGGH